MWIFVDMGGEGGGVNSYDSSLIEGINRNLLHIDRGGRNKKSYSSSNHRLVGMNDRYPYD